MKKQLILIITTLGFMSSAHAQWSGTNPLTTTSLVGVGTTSPSAKLDVRHAAAYATGPALCVTMNNTALAMPPNPNYTNAFEVKNIRLGGGFPASSVTTTDFMVAGDGTVHVRRRLRIGTTAANGTYNNYALSVDGDMIAKKCVIQVNSWADYVFADNYALPSLNEVESFVKENKHLPGVPNEAEIKENGVEIGEMNKILMQKVEELTLYMIQLKKENDALSNRINSLEKKD